MYFKTRFNIVLTLAYLLGSVANSQAQHENQLSAKYITQKGIRWSGNLTVENFRNGDQIPFAATEKEWMIAGKNKQPAWCYYDNNPENGKLYNWFAVNDPRGLAPDGWRMPDTNDWKVFLDDFSQVLKGDPPIESFDFKKRMKVLEDLDVYTSPDYKSTRFYQEKLQSRVNQEYNQYREDSLKIVSDYNNYLKKGGWKFRERWASDSAMASFFGGKRGHTQMTDFVMRLETGFYWSSNAPSDSQKQIKIKAVEDSTRSQITRWQNRTDISEEQKRNLIKQIEESKVLSLSLIEQFDEAWGVGFYKREADMSTKTSEGKTIYVYFHKAKIIKNSKYAGFSIMLVKSSD